MSRLERLFVVDRCEGEYLWLVSDEDLSVIQVPASTLPFPVSEGACLRVQTHRDGSPDWASAGVDLDPQKRRTKEIKEALARLKRRDPGGDVVL